MERGHPGAIMTLVPSHVDLVRNKEVENVVIPLLRMEVTLVQEMAQKSQIVTWALARVSRYICFVVDFNLVKLMLLKSP